MSLDKYCSIQYVKAFIFTDTESLYNCFLSSFDCMSPEVFTLESLEILKEYILNNKKTHIINSYIRKNITDFINYFENNTIFNNRKERFKYISKYNEIKQILNQEINYDDDIFYINEFNKRTLRFYEKYGIYIDEPLFLNLYRNRIILSLIYDNYYSKILVEDEEFEKNDKLYYKNSFLWSLNNYIEECPSILENKRICRRIRYILMRIISNDYEYETNDVKILKQTSLKILEKIR